MSKPNFILYLQNLSKIKKWLIAKPAAILINLNWWKVKNEDFMQIFHHPWKKREMDCYKLDAFFSCVKILKTFDLPKIFLNYIFCAKKVPRLIVSFLPRADATFPLPFFVFKCQISPKKTEKSRRPLEGCPKDKELNVLKEIKWVSLPKKNIWREEKQKKVGVEMAAALSPKKIVNVFGNLLVSSLSLLFSSSALIQMKQGKGARVGKS